MTDTKKLTDVVMDLAATSDIGGKSLLMSDAQGKMNKFSPNVMLDGVFIMYHSGNSPTMVKPHKWPMLQASGEVASGVVVVEGGKVLVVAPTECDNAGLLWSSAVVDGGATTTIDRLTAMNDWNGKANTAAIIAASTPSAVTDTAEYAPGFCNLYSHGGLAAGKWWLPSAGELVMIIANMTKINCALSLITGATQLAETRYWTSTEHSATYAWNLNLNTVLLNSFTKAGNKGRVRPVSAFTS